MVQLANSAEVSQPFLSQVEHGNTMPSVINLHRIAQALDTTAHALLEQGSRAPTRIVRASEARSHNLGPAAIVRFCVTGTRLLDCNEVTAEPQSAAEAPTTHTGEEFVYVISGTIRVNVGETDYTLEPGDTVYYPATVPHQWFNDSDRAARFLFVTSPPTF